LARDGARGNIHASLKWRARLSPVPLKRKTEPDHRLICPFLPSRIFVKCPSIRKMDDRAVGIEITSLLHKDLHGNDLVPLPHFPLLLDAVKLA
jgi:hypothetical protein